MFLIITCTESRVNVFRSDPRQTAKRQVKQVCYLSIATVIRAQTHYSLILLCYSKLPHPKAIDLVV